MHPLLFLLHPATRPAGWGDIYHAVFNTEIFFMPLVILVTTYIMIYILLRRLVAMVKEASLHRRNETSQSAGRVDRPKKTVMKALKMSLIHVVAFIISWTPYTVMGIVTTIDPAATNKVHLYFYITPSKSYSLCSYFQITLS